MRAHDMHDLLLITSHINALKHTHTHTPSGSVRHRTTHPC